MAARALVLLAALVHAAALAGPTPLSDEELARVRGRDGISFAADVQLNQHGGTVGGANRLSIGQTVGGRTTYLVVDDISGRIQMLGLGLSANTADDGTNYAALTMPALVRFTNVGADAIGVQADPRAPVTDSLGRITLNGELSMQGQLRMWTH